MAHDPSTTSSSPARVALPYALMISVAVGAFFFIRHLGQDLVAPEPAATVAAAAKGADPHTLATVLLALAVITVAARALGRLLHRTLGQPPVIGEIAAGLLLGPSVLGALAPSAYAALLPAGGAPFLGLLANVGVVLFMFLVGLELDTGTLRKASHHTLVISHASILVPFVLGSGLSLWLYPRYGTRDVDFTTFALFVGISMSVTAFPVLARILKDRRVQRTSLGVTALACAAVDDVSAWTLLALVVGVANAKLSSAALTIPVVLLYLAVMIWVGRPALRWLAAREERNEGVLSQDTLAAVFVALLVSSWVTETIGVHALFGAFLLGALLPHEGRLAEQLRTRIEDIVVVLFLPAFFAFTGMRTHLSLVSGGADWAVCGLIIAVATLGKFGGSFVAARLVGLGWRSSAALGILMNTRGLMELIVLNIGLDLGVLSPTLFAMFVMMALVTTFATTPVLNAVMCTRGFADEPETVGDGRRVA